MIAINLAIVSIRLIVALTSNLFDRYDVCLNNNDFMNFIDSLVSFLSIDFSKY